MVYLSDRLRDAGLIKDNIIRTHWILVFKASATACGVDRVGELSAQNPPTTRLQDYVTCRKCKLVILDYNAHVVVAARLVEALESAAKAMDGDVDYLAELDVAQKAINAYRVGGESYNDDQWEFTAANQIMKRKGKTP